MLYSQQSKTSIVKLQFTDDDTLGDQEIVQEGNQYLSVWAISWKYPGSPAPMTARVRINAFETPGDDSAGSRYDGIIEVWKDSGWINLDSVFFDATFFSVKDVEDRALIMAESFYTGKPSDTFRMDDFPPFTGIKTGKSKPKESHRTQSSKKLDDNEFDMI